MNQEWKEAPTCIECGEMLYHDSHSDPEREWLCHNYEGCSLAGIWVVCDVAYKINRKWFETIDSEPFCTVFVVDFNIDGKMVINERKARKNPHNEYQIAREGLGATLPMPSCRVGKTKNEAIENYVAFLKKQILEKSRHIDDLMRQISEAEAMK